MPSERGRRIGPDRPRLREASADAVLNEVASEALVTSVHAGPDLRVPESVVDIELRHSTLTGVNLAERDLRRLAARDVRFERCDLSGATLDGASLHRVEFVGCRLTGLMLTNATLRHVTIHGCRADLMNWRMSTATYMVADSCSLREADFYEARFDRVALVRCDLSEASFRACRLHEVDLHGSQLQNLRDTSGLAGAAISTDQVIPLALGLFPTFGIRVTDAPEFDHQIDGSVSTCDPNS